MAFVNNETRDLRLYGMGSTTPLPTGSFKEYDNPLDHEMPRMRTAVTEAEVENKMSTALGRVVFGATRWEVLRWHPS